MEALLAELAALRMRVEALEAERGTVCAPFRVVDQAGRTLFSIELDEEAPEQSVVQVSLYDRLTGETLVNIIAGESMPDDQHDELLPGFGAMQIGRETEICAGTITLTGHECRNTGHADQIVISTERGPHIDLYLGQAGEQPLLEIHARDYESGIHIARGNSSEGDWPARGIYLGTVPDSREPTLTLWNAADKAVLELVADTAGHGSIVINDGEGAPRLTLPPASVNAAI